MIQLSEVHRFANRLYGSTPRCSGRATGAKRSTGPTRHGPSRTSRTPGAVGLAIRVKGQASRWLVRVWTKRYSVGLGNRRAGIRAIRRSAQGGRKASDLIEHIQVPCRLCRHRSRVSHLKSSHRGVSWQIDTSLLPGRHAHPRLLTRHRRVAVMSINIQNQVS